MHDSYHRVSGKKPEQKVRERRFSGEEMSKHLAKSESELGAHRGSGAESVSVRLLLARWVRDCQCSAFAR